MGKLPVLMPVLEYPLSPVRVHGPGSSHNPISPHPRRIVITTLGSLGDVHPFLALATGLKDRGHDVVIATDNKFRQKIEQAGFEFARVQLDTDWGDPRSVSKLRSWGLLRIVRNVLVPMLRQTYEGTFAATEGADVLIGMEGNYASRLVAEKRNIPWISAIHFPLGLFSAHDPPVLASFPRLSRRLHFLGPIFWQLVRKSSRQLARVWSGPWHELRREIGLPRVRGVSPLIDSQSPLLHLVLLSRLLGNEQADWPAASVITGFPWYVGDDNSLSKEVQRFLDDGPAPIVFTLGTTISRDTREHDFFERSVAVAESLGKRAILFIEDRNNFPKPSPRNILSVTHVPFGNLLPRVEAIVHHGGLNTSALAMRSGRPMLVVPCAWDQHNTADRLVKLGVARSIRRSQYTVDRVVSELRHLLNDQAYAKQAAAVAAQVREEDGVQVACDAIEQLLPSMAML